MLRAVLLLALACAAPLAAQARKVDFEKQVLPILEKRCIECHRTTYVDKDGKRHRPKGRVMLDSVANIEKSKRGDVVIAGKPDESLLIEVVSLPKDDEDRMPPPDEGAPLSKAQIELLTRWIAEGADYGDWKGAVSDEEAAKAVPSRAVTQKRRGPPPEDELSKGLRPVPAETLQQFEGTPFQVRSIGNGNPLLLVSCSGKSDQVGDAEVAALAPIADHVFELDLARSGVGDEACKTIAKMRRLTRLDLRETRVGDTGAKELAACRELRSLNLFSTEVGDYAMAAFEQLEELRNLYIWQTEVSAKAALRLREKLPSARIVFGADLPEPDGGDDGRRR